MGLENLLRPPPHHQVTVTARFEHFLSPFTWKLKFHDKILYAYTSEIAVFSCS
jgi:hypothetical protein